MTDVFGCGIRVDSDAMGTHEVMYEAGFTGQLQGDGVGRQGGHMTIDAIVREAH